MECLLSSIKQEHLDKLIEQRVHWDFKLHRRRSEFKKGVKLTGEGTIKAFVLGGTREVIGRLGFCTLMEQWYGPADKNLVYRMLRAPVSVDRVFIIRDGDGSHIVSPHSWWQFYEVNVNLDKEELNEHLRNRLDYDH